MVRSALGRMPLCIPYIALRTRWKPLENLIKHEVDFFKEQIGLYTGASWDQEDSREAKDKEATQVINTYILLNFSMFFSSSRHELQL